MPKTFPNVNWFYFIPKNMYIKFSYKLEIFLLLNHLRTLNKMRIVFSTIFSKV